MQPFVVTLHGFQGTKIEESGWIATGKKESKVATEIQEKEAGAADRQTSGSGTDAGNGTANFKNNPKENSECNVKPICHCRKAQHVCDTEDAMQKGRGMPSHGVLQLEERWPSLLCSTCGLTIPEQMEQMAAD